jgi:hypothetical protein
VELKTAEGRGRRGGGCALDKDTLVSTGFTTRPTCVGRVHPDHQAAHPANLGRITPQGG